MAFLIDTEEKGMVFGQNLKSLSGGHLRGGQIDLLHHVYYL